MLITHILATLFKYSFSAYEGKKELEHYGHIGENKLLQICGVRFGGGNVRYPNIALPVSLKHS